jgi:hypothetical protein
VLGSRDRWIDVLSHGGGYAFSLGSDGDGCSLDLGSSRPVPSADLQADDLRGWGVPEGGDCDDGPGAGVQAGCWAVTSLLPMVCIGGLVIDGQFLRGDEWFLNGSSE